MSKHNHSDILDTETPHPSSHTHVPDQSELPPTLPQQSQAEQEPSEPSEHHDTTMIDAHVTLPDITSHHDFMWQ